ncbi:hypothetical protein PC116_g6600 [Phytophthora cactorum]|nr:hypothetical protein Pcac1_g10262 [Phytophthora cactorum]KAG2915977.1 hypothetical protein PC114_g7641 [Phytophthora cactorum]KAG3026547.1 hypothetical protein PC119_g7777 [Phytophthora cactorum]KAG3028953.1 hypothetical protein PC120_g4566 [Phytophthora cactorum]KAG3185834.1 hypothetical protein C6341_g4216 [Phytophthora cactorum]
MDTGGRQVYAGRGGDPGYHRSKHHATRERRLDLDGDRSEEVVTPIDNRNPTYGGAKGKAVSHKLRWIYPRNSTLLSVIFREPLWAPPILL